MIGRTDVIAGYKEFLDRLPESDEVISAHQAAHKNVEAFRASIRQSPEYQTKNGGSARNPASPALPSKWGHGKAVTPDNLDSFIACATRLDMIKYDGTYPGADATTFRVGVASKSVIGQLRSSACFCT